MVAAVADLLEFEYKYTSGVIAWVPDDRPTDVQIEAVLDTFGQTAWAGLEPDRYAWSAVEHRERGDGIHVPGHRAYINATKLHAGLAVEADLREVIRDYLVQRVERGVVHSRADVVEALKEAGLDVPRQGTHYVTAHDLESGERCTSMTSSQNDLRSRFQRRLENERAAIEATTARELTVLGENLRDAAQNALRPSTPIRRRGSGRSARCSCAGGCGR